MKEKAQEQIDILRGFLESLRISMSGPEIEEKRKQLSAVDRSIQQMQRQDIAVPDELLNLKMKLVNDLSGSDLARETFQYAISELRKILKECGLSFTTTKVNPQPAIRDKRVKTEPSVLREYILKALRHFKGRAKCREVLSWMEDKLKDQLTPRDRSMRKSGKIVWENNAQWERYVMVQEGLLRSDSPQGIWELCDDEKSRQGSGAL
jgi:hypothetical protein